MIRRLWSARWKTPLLMATRKYYKSQENLRAKLDKDTGKISAFAVKTVVETPEQVEDPESAGHGGRRAQGRSVA